MGVNSAGYLVLPKMIAALTCIPFLVILSMALGHRGWVVGGRVDRVELCRRTSNTACRSISTPST